MQGISRLLTIVTILCGVTTISFFVHSIAPDAFGFISPAVPEFMTDNTWLRWAAAALLIASLVANVSIRRRLERRDAEQAADAGTGTPVG